MDLTQRKETRFGRWSGVCGRLSEDRQTTGQQKQASRNLKHLSPASHVYQTRVSVPFMKAATACRDGRPIWIPCGVQFL